MGAALVASHDRDVFVSAMTNFYGPVGVLDGHDATAARLFLRVRVPLCGSRL
jgi:hypothetical protein